MRQGNELSRRKSLVILGTMFFLLFMGCRASLPSPEVRDTSAPPVVFAHITDIHMGYAGVTEERLANVIKQIDERGPTFVVCTGDIAHFRRVREWQRFREIFRALRMPCHFIPGNHDTGELPDAESTALWRKHMGAENFSFVESGVAFIGVNLTPFWQPDLDNLHKQKAMRDKILAWLSLELQNAGGCRARFVFGHFPIYLTHLNEKVYQNSISEPETRRQILEVLEAGKCDAYFCGHTHFGWENEIGLGDRPGIRQVVAAPLSYPALVKGWQKHEFSRESRCLGWYLCKYHPDSGELVKEFVEVNGDIGTVVFDRY